MKLVVFMSFLLMLSLCSSGFDQGHHGVTDHSDPYSSNKVEETIYRTMDYPDPGPNPGHDPKIPPPSPPTKKA
ncbi:unnamed protein product [Microthlaspi erraticum]|uniref:Uncharacterized protein n=1 Tax=Microthlaspi erraticum TaxID=1685480 RepID=A0A6D2L873_9BRAS|nr:unnamed protein product [Microthlaspi erraticum]